MAFEPDVSFTLNGRSIAVRVEPGRTLLNILREDLDLTGTKQACDAEGECGACTVLLDGQAVRSCLLPVEKVSGRSVLTIEGLGTLQHLHPLQQAFIDHGAVQCGYCTPGMILSAAALLAREPNPGREEILEALEGVLCRCTGYVKIVEAVEAAAAVMRGERPAVRLQEPAHLVGGSDVRADALHKVTGAARYAEDIKMPSHSTARLLYAAVARSPHPHARVLAVDPAPALGTPGVVRVLTAADVPGANSLEGYSRNEHLLASPQDPVRMIGDAVALVVGRSPQAAAAGATALRVAYDPLPHNYDAVQAMAPGALPLYPGGNILNSHEIHYGDLDAALSSADVLLETQYLTTFMEHSALERETVLGYVDERGRITVVGGHQQPHWARNWIAALLDLPPDEVRVIVPPMGGTFGGKQDPWPLMAVALAAYHLRRPVRLAYTRRESFDVSPKRHPYDVTYRLGARADGTLTGAHLRIVANTGAYDCDGYYIPYYGLVAGGGPYRWQALDGCAWSVYTNGPKAGQMRGFGTPQSTFALECTLDELAVRLGMDPLDLRLRNALDDQSVTFLGYPVSETLGYRPCLEAVRPHYRTALSTAAALNSERSGDLWRRGVGLAGMWYRFGKAAPITCEARAELGLDGYITLYFSAPDYGQGTATVMSQLAAETIGLPREKFLVVNADTALTPDSGIQGASRSTYWVGGAVVQAAKVLRMQIFGVAAEMLDRHPAALTLDAAGMVVGEGVSVPLTEVAAEMSRIGQRRRVKGVFAPGHPLLFREDGQPENLPFFISGAHLTEVDVNIETGQVRVARVVAVHDVGRVISPRGAEGQIEGAVLMSLGAALMEEYIPGVSTGFSDYYLPTIRSMPEIEVILVEVPSRWGPLGVKGLGEGASLPTAPAILNGIYHATGARIRQLPATPERVLAAIHRAEQRPTE